MEYVLNLLRAKLAEELMAEETCKQATAGQGFAMKRQTMNSFNDRLNEARERIPQLQQAIEKLEA